MGTEKSEPYKGSMLNKQHHSLSTKIDWTIENMNLENISVAILITQEAKTMRNFSILLTSKNTIRTVKYNTFLFIGKK